MFEKLAARFRSSDTDYRLLVPLLISTMLVQLVTAMVRVTTSYRAVELNLSIVWLGLIAATFAICPILIAVRVGRQIDRGYDAQTTWLGAAIFAIACAGFAFASSPVALLVASAIMGTGHIMLMASQQMLCVRAAGPRSLELVFGNYMVAGAIGQGAGPYIVGWLGGAASVPPTQLLFIVGAAIAALTFAVSLAIRPGPDKPLAAGDSGDRSGRPDRPHPRTGRRGAGGRHPGLGLRHHRDLRAAARRRAQHRRPCRRPAADGAGGRSRWWRGCSTRAWCWRSAAGR